MEICTAACSKVIKHVIVHQCQTENQPSKDYVNRHADLLIASLSDPFSLSFSLQPIPCFIFRIILIFKRGYQSKLVIMLKEISVHQQQLSSYYHPYRGCTRLHERSEICTNNI